MKNLATIIPPATPADGYTRTQGTRVQLSDGSFLSGIKRIEIVAEVNGIWRARIDCMVNVQVMPGVMIEVGTPGKPVTWWRRALLRLAGVSALDITSMEEASSVQWAPLTAKEPT